MLHTLIIKIMKSILETKNQKPYIYLSLQYIRCKDNHIFFAIVKHQIENGNFNKYELLFCQKWSKEKKRKENGWVKWVKKEIQLYDTVTVSDIDNILLKSPCGEGNGHPLQYCLENPGTVEPGGLPSLGSHRVGHDWSDLAAAATKVPELGR